MIERTPSPPTDLRQALRDIVRRPLQTLVPPWSWKAAALSAVVRGAAFFASNLRSGTQQAVRAMLVEAGFAVVAAGLIGAISQQLRRAEPLWATVAVVWIGLPAVLVLAQAGVHQLAHTPHVTSGLVVSFCFTAFCSAFSWYAMRHGTMLGGRDETTVIHDAKCLPGIALNFMLVAPRALLGLLGHHGEAQSKM